eukprot:15361787-Ditylum_brightwellii.AAC.1
MEEEEEEDMKYLVTEAVRAIWSFACLKSCSTTSITSILPYDTLLDIGCSILCQTKEELKIARKHRFAVDDIVDRLAKSSSDVVIDNDIAGEEEKGKEEEELATVKMMEDNCRIEEEGEDGVDVPSSMGDAMTKEGVEGDSSSENTTMTNAFADNNEHNSTTTATTETPL